jgi:hypothetical protein
MIINSEQQRSVRANYTRLFMSFSNGTSLMISIHKDKIRKHFTQKDLEPPTSKND